jgi:hypothetical protein
MKSVNKPLSRNRIQSITALGVIVAVAIAGVYLLVSSHAQTLYVSNQADSGSLTSPATVANCTGTSDGKCVQFGSAATTTTPCVNNPPTVSADSLYPLQHVTVFDGTTFAADNFLDYGNIVQPPAGYVAKSHAIPTADGLVIKGYIDPISLTHIPPIKGVTGGSGEVILNSGDTISTSGGFDVCFSMSNGNISNGGWQNVHLVLISWPNDNVWNDGENDFFEGSPQNMAINVHEIGPQPSKFFPVGQWPSSLANGAPHDISARWDPVNGYRYYLDGSLVATLHVGGGITTPIKPHHLAIQMQDITETSTNDETATFYWMATYGYQ